MGQDLRNLFKEEQTEGVQLKQGHKQRFEHRLEAAFPQKSKDNNWLKIAAAIAIVLSLGFAGFYYLNAEGLNNEIVENNPKYNSMGDISPDLKKVEDFYLNHINYQIAKIKITDENKIILAAYFDQLGELQNEYDTTIASISEEEISEETIDALIQNLQSRLKLMYQLKGELKKMNNLNTQENESNKA